LDDDSPESSSLMKRPDTAVLRIGAVRADPALDEIVREGKSIKLEPRSMRLLVYLAEHVGQVVSVEELLTEVWRDVVVTQDSVYTAIASLRRALGDDANKPLYIANVPRRGYRLVASVGQWVDGPTTSPRAASATKAAGKESQTSALANPPTHSIAILPFVDMSENHDQQYFAEGMAEEVSNLLARVPGIRVIGRDSCLQFRERHEDVRTVGSLLRVAYLVEGSVRRVASRVRVTARLIDAQDGSQLWSQSYDNDFADVLTIQDQIATNLVRALQVAVGVDYPSRPRLKSGMAYDFYLRGRHALDRFDRTGFERAAGYFQQALELDPTAIRVAESLSLVHAYIAEWGFASPGEGFERARRSAERVLELDASSAVALTHLASIHAIFDWDWTAAVDKIRRALALAPRDPGILVAAGFIYLALHRLEQAASFFNAASALDPLGAASHSGLGTVCYRTERLADAEAEFRRALEISPTFLWAHWALGTVLLAAGRLEAALLQMQQAGLEGGGDAGLAIVYHAMGRSRESDAALVRATRAYEERWAYGIAEAHAYRGEIDQAFTWLDRAFQQKDVALYRVKGNPLIRNLEIDARYHAFLRKMRLPE
jgi:adenylate cyclase